MHTEDIDFYEIGERLLDHAQQLEEVSARGRVSELFPYIYQASKRMSTRAISDFLSSNFGVKLSAVSVSTALKNEKKHWERFAEIIEPAANIVGRTIGLTAHHLLSDRDLFCHYVDKVPTISGETGLREYCGSVDFLNRRWWTLDQDVRDSCLCYITDGTEESTEPATDLEQELAE